MPVRTLSVKLKTLSAAGMTIQRAGPGKFQFEKVHFLFRSNLNITCNRQKA